MRPYSAYASKAKEMRISDGHDSHAFEFDKVERYQWRGHKRGHHLGAGIGAPERQSRYGASSVQLPLQERPQSISVSPLSAAAVATTKQVANTSPHRGSPVPVFVCATRCQTNCSEQGCGVAAPTRRPDFQQLVSSGELLSTDGRRTELR